MTGRERGQLLIEVAALLPACIASAVVLVDCGVVIADRIAVARATGVGASALVEYDQAGAEAAVRDALPPRLAADAAVTVAAGSVQVRVTSSPPTARLVTLPGIELESSASADPTAGGKR